MKRVPKSAGLLLLTVAFVLGGTAAVRGQEPAISPAAKAEFEQGRAASERKDHKQAAAFFRRAIELDPHHAEAHNKFRSASFQVHFAGMDSELPEDERGRQLLLLADKARKELIAIYEGWLQRDANIPLYQYMLGELYQYTDYEKATRHLLNAVRLDPKLARAYAVLAMVSEVRGDEKMQLEYLKRAAEAAPQDASHAFYYADALKKSDPALHRKKALEVAERFPNEERGAQSLYWLAKGSDRIEERIAIYERLKSSFPPERFSWSESGMTELFEGYAKSDPRRALAVAEEMGTLLKDGRSRKAWEERVAYQRNLLQARALIGEKRYLEASALLESTALLRHVGGDALHLAKAEALAGAGQTVRAYDEMLRLVSSEPTDALQEALKTYGAALGKTARQVSAEVRLALEARAKPVKDFSFARYGDEKQVSLSDYRGKVVLLNFWYPFCGPCRGENPELQRILEKYGSHNFVILAVNVHPEEDKYVLPYLNGNKFGFVPLRSNLEFAAKEFQAIGMPSNFVLDQKGRIVFQPRVIQGDKVRTLELQIEALLPEGRHPHTSSRKPLLTR
jgi:thiol-disulfide isomerase/thioredoxin